MEIRGVPSLELGRLVVPGQHAEERIVGAASRHVATRTVTRFRLAPMARLGTVRFQPNGGYPGCLAAWLRMDSTTPWLKRARSACAVSRQGRPCKVGPQQNKVTLRCQISARTAASWPKGAAARHRFARTERQRAGQPRISLYEKGDGSGTPTFFRRDGRRVTMQLQQQHMARSFKRDKASVSRTCARKEGRQDSITSNCRTVAATFS